MLLHPSGALGLQLDMLPHWPDAHAVGQALIDRDIAPDTVCVNRTGREHGETMYKPGAGACRSLQGL
ncbi:hypothetical protein [Streptomyces sp. NPDC050564]|uniref:hypothetical protein n=1 Tax=Streptomyces sp. NPDC050564 TaxID=3365631 RepID=UPI0037B30D8C